ncbi:cysteine proteinase [Linderina pennispora]|uniref:Cysteine proteinase n=1 Tax=Linderina pennispora TaxID=61395 RepID=A0A1Y1WNK9_9FUNG|nr:cysteine proteinase [Linderina pennispora]ORX74694.1 cysteine proteinase [Linderina pennispora]
MVRTHSEGQGSKRHSSKTHGYDDFTRLNRALKKIGLYCKEMDGDGNCLFRALADQVDGTPDTHSRHRVAVCDYMDQHADEFAPFIDESQPFPQYVYNMRRLGVFAGNLELVAFARNYRVDIKVYQLGGNVFVISGAPSDQPNSTQRNMPPVHIAYHSYEHYSSVRNRHGPHNGLPKIKASSQDSIAPPLDDQAGVVLPKAAVKARPSTHDSRAHCIIM